MELASSSFVMYRRALNEVRRLPLTLIFVPIVLPIFMLVVFARVFEAVSLISQFPDGTTYLEYITPASLMMASMIAAAGAGISTAVERQTGYYDRMRIAPVGPGASEIGRRASDATRLVLFAVTLSLLSALLGDHVTNWPLGLFVAAVLTASWGVAYGGLTFAVCVRTGSAEVYQAILPLFFPVLFMSSAFVPKQVLPDWLRQVATYNPISYITDAIRHAYLGELDGHALLWAAVGIVVVATFTQLLITWAVRGVARG